MIQTVISTIKLCLASAAHQRSWLNVPFTPSRTGTNSTDSSAMRLWPRFAGTMMRAIVFILFGLVILSPTAFSQTSPTPPTQELSDQSSTQIEGSQKSREELRRELQRLQESHGPNQSSLKSDSLNSNRQDYLDPYRPIQDPEITPPEIKSGSVDAALSSLRKRIELLNQAMKQEGSEPRSANPPQLPNSDPNTAPNPQPAENATFPPVSPNAVELQTSPTQVDASSESNDPEAANVEIPTGEPVLPSPINTFEVANSLFQTGSVAKALEYYQAIENESRSEHEQFWYQYFVASCMRQGGDRAEATKRYRELASSGKSSFPVESAKWWLSHLEQIKTSKETFQQIDAQINLIAKELEK